MMKKITLLSLILLVATGHVFCQATQKHSLAQTDYLNKSIKQKKAARLLLIGGGVLITASLVLPRGELVYDGNCVGVWCDDKYKNDEVLSALFIAGGLSALSSIPVSIAASKNKKRSRAAVVFIDMEQSPALLASVSRIQSYAVAGLKLRL